ncbi:hypothetical protein VNO77_39834 [Canavalia gladiata]|uniref:t-SNARE coiled-coil homology domain-containing protein n=1 Tax=Canavalia gladiata TaxID=3824 RepID=A0AAN9K022_CANGL
MQVIAQSVRTADDRSLRLVKLQFLQCKGKTCSSILSILSLLTNNNLVQISHTTRSIIQTKVKSIFYDLPLTRFYNMSEVFEGYERQYCELSANISRKCSSVPLVDQEQKQQKFSEIKTGLDEADVLIRKMDLEARSLQPSVKAMLLAKLREYKSDLSKLKKEFKRLTSPNADEAAREDLLETGRTDTHLASADQRERLTMSVERLSDSSERIMESRRTLLETEELGVSILQDLHGQRETLLNSHKKLHGVDDTIDKSKKVLTTMSRRITRNKWIIASVIGALVFAIIVILFYKLSR